MELYGSKLAQLQANELAELRQVEKIKLQLQNLEMQKSLLQNEAGLAMQRVATLRNKQTTIKGDRREFVESIALQYAITDVDRFGYDDETGEVLRFEEEEQQQPEQE